MTAYELRISDWSSDVCSSDLFSGKHDNSAIGVANKDYDAAAVANEVMFRMFEREVVKADQVRTIYKSQTFPTPGYGHAHNLAPELAAKLTQALFPFEWKGSALEEEFVADDKFVANSHQSEWDTSLKIDKTTGLTPNCH